MEVIGFSDEGGTYRLIRIDSSGNETSIVLTEANLVQLAKILPEQLQAAAMQRLGANLGSQGIETIPATQVAEIGLGTDLHQRQLHLGARDRDGNTLWLAFPLSVAELLLDQLPSWVGKLRRSAATKAQ